MIQQIFNADRNSGHNLISDEYEYAQKYGVGHHYPNIATAVIRELNNAVPISTQNGTIKALK